MTLHFVYVLHSEKSRRYYIGSSKDVEQRLAQHNSGMMRSTRPHRPWLLMYTESHETLVEARRRESQIKSWKNPSYMERTLGLTAHVK